MEFFWSKLEAGTSIWEAGEAVRGVGATQTAVCWAGGQEKKEEEEEEEEGGGGEGW